MALFAETVYSEAQDLDLFVGRDLNGNGQADEDELVCASTSPTELERLPDQSAASRNLVDCGPELVWFGRGGR